MTGIIDKKKQMVFVAMSGGVDSSVAALLLQNEGYEVTGVYMKNWSGDNYGIQSDCPWEKDQEDVEKVCDQLNIPFRSFNFEREYREKVVEYFFDEYKKGRTPNPDVMCNKEIKFHLFLNKAINEGADLIATGHYVRKDLKDGKFKLLKGIDQSKDQSYFLYNITQNQLSKVLFPVGGYQKKEVRKIAFDNGLVVANKPDSQGICFIGEIDVQKFLRERITPHTGEIIDVDGLHVVGKHDGIEFFTIGQREGLNIGGSKKPYFVIKKDVDKNILYVGQGNDHPELLKKNVELEDIYLINPDKQIKEYEHLQASVRYRHTPSGVKIVYQGETIQAIFDQPQRAVTPGQSMVFYHLEECLGGGIIK